MHGCWKLCVFFLRKGRIRVTVIVSFQLHPADRKFAQVSRWVDQLPKAFSRASVGTNDGEAPATHFHLACLFDVMVTSSYMMGKSLLLSSISACLIDVMVTSSYMMGKPLLHTSISACLIDVMVTSSYMYLTELCP